MKNVENSLQFLEKRYEDALKYVADSDYYADFAKEKIYHSMQVIGAMHYIMKHEETFQSDDEHFIKCAKIATILHDVGRFSEIKMLYDAKNAGKTDVVLDHGQTGCDILRSLPEYSDIMIYLPVKHHDKITGSYFEDAEFLNISNENLKRKVEKIIFLVRDADKAANFYLFNNSVEKLFPTMFNASKKYAGQSWNISAEAREDFVAKRLLRSESINNHLGSQMHLLAWLFDMNYRSTIDLVLKNGSLKKMLLNTICYCKDEEEKEFIKANVNEYLSLRLKEKTVLL